MVKNNNEKVSKEICLICMNDLANVNLKQMQTNLDGCQHEFCFRCISRWSKKMPTCPVCRKNIYKMISKKHGRTFNHSTFLKNGKLTSKSNQIGLLIPICFQYYPMYIIPSFILTGQSIKRVYSPVSGYVFVQAPIL